jgi:hypothetical protein
MKNKRSGWPRKLTASLLGCLERQIKKYPAMTAAALRESIPELSKVSEGLSRTSCT